MHKVRAGVQTSRWTLVFLLSNNEISTYASCPPAGVILVASGWSPNPQFLIGKWAPWRLVGTNRLLTWADHLECVPVPLREHAVEMGLRRPQPSMDEFADVSSSASFRIPTDVGADQPCAGSAANDLASFTGQIPS